jgi:glycosyltransferase involved in cell wall biosynthesis
MKFTVIMQSLISEYPNSARNKETKIIRAVNSVLTQTFQDFELIIVADGCQKTVDIILQNFDLSDNLKLLKLERIATEKQWSANGRNIGIDKATGKYILYLDIDDYFNPEYLQDLDDLLTNKNLYFVDDIVFNKDVPVQRRCNIKPFMCGTSNIIHKKGRSRWANVARYGHEDWQFIQSLINEYKEYDQLNIAGYVVAHIPGKYDK